MQRAHCAICADRIWGLGRQGYKCINCKLLVHKKCHKLVTTECGKPVMIQVRSLTNVMPFISVWSLNWTLPVCRIYFLYIINYWWMLSRNQLCPAHHRVSHQAQLIPKVTHKYTQRNLLTLEGNDLLMFRSATKQKSSELFIFWNACKTFRLLFYGRTVYQLSWASNLASCLTVCIFNNTTNMHFVLKCWYFASKVSDFLLVFL